VSKDEEIVGMINSHYKAAEGVVQSIVPKWISYYKQYRGVRDETRKKYPYRSKLFIPYSFTSVEGVLAKIMEILFMEKPIVKALPQMEDDAMSADMIERLLDYQFYMMRIYPMAQMILRDALIYGTAFAKVYWDREVKTLEVPGRITMPDGSVKTDMAVIEQEIFDGPRIVSIPNERLFIDPGASSIKDAEFVIHKEWKTIDYLKQQKKLGARYKNLGKLEEGSVEDIGPLQQAKLQALGISPAEELEQIKKVEVWEYWTNDKKYTTVDRKHLIESEDNTLCPGNKPFVLAKPISLSNELFGLGFMEMLFYLQHELNDVRNQRMDNVNLIINKIIKVSSHAGVDLNYLKSIPGAIWLAERPELITPLEMSDVTASSYLEAQEIKSDMQHTIGDYDYFRGASPSTSRETATTVIRLQEAAMNRISGITRYIEESFVVPLAQLMMDLNKQYLNVEKPIRIFGEQGQKWIELSQNDITQYYDFQAMGSIRASLKKQQEKEKSMELLGMLLPLAEQLNLNLPLFMTDLLGKMGYPNAGKYILPVVPQSLTTMGGQQGMPQDTPQEGTPQEGLPPEEEEQREILPGGPQPTEEEGVPPPPEFNM